MKLGVVVTTYNSPTWLEKVLYGYENQTDKDFQVIVADDGSGPDTKKVISDFQRRGKLEITHEWQKDEGFQKTKILNQCVRNSDCDYLVFTDGDCIPRFDYIDQHKRMAKPGFFVSGGLYRLSKPVSDLVTEDAISSRQVFNFDFLRSIGQPSDLKRLKLGQSNRLARLLNFITPTKATWNGGNTGCWRSDVVAVNGFDERMQYGGLDREMGERMMNNGIKGIQARYSVITLHLDHKRGYENAESWAKNRSIRDEVKRQNKTWTEFGMQKR